ncbi:MAG: glucose-6-phosphate isomerase [Oscillospiraceae bacterium]|jgi:glucose-6-phosphate isomerase|nr:glucose-6-phosphate isomerase [Oscillospiraceae bacterium]
MVKIDISGAKEFFGPTGPDFSKVSNAHRTLFERSGEGAEYTGWLELPERVKAGELKAILSAAARIRGNSEALVVIGIGGSYLGAKAAIDLLRSPNYNMKKKDTPDVFFAGNGVSPAAISEIIELIGDRDFTVNVISKSGGTLEPALSFRVFKALLEKKYGAAGAKRRIIATTDAQRGILHDTAVSEGWERFIVPNDVGGRFSVLSAVGLLPMAVAGIDIEKVLNCAVRELHDLDLRSSENPAWIYAGVRQHLYGLGRQIEILACFEPSFRFMAEWWKQLFGESEGKNGIGIYPASVEFSADLHSMGQFIQDGPRRLMETVVSFEDDGAELKVPFELRDRDGLNYLAGVQFGEVQRIVTKAVAGAHIKGDVPNIAITASRRDEEGFAELVCFFEMSCALSAYVSGVNPFNQPGVEAYKKNMFKMLQERE